jgi:2-polyprenyl-6-methoxyphenol hydroxylase-like FAD-dependent oxidoreductase
MKIAIAGAGIGGLAAAALLAQDGHEVTVFDQFDAPRPVGSGLVIQPVGLAALARIGVLEDAVALGAKVTRMLGREVDNNRVILDVRFPRKGGEFGLAIHRASLFHVLWHGAQTSGATVQASARVTGSHVTRDGRFLDTSSATHGPFDLVVDAMGVNSTLSPLVAKPLPFGALWASVPWPDSELPRDLLSQRYRRADHMAGIMPIGTLPGESTFMAGVFWSLPRAALSLWTGMDFAAWKAEVAAFWPDYAPFVEGLTKPSDMATATYSHGTLKRPYAERLAFIGDAAHRTSPQLGQGANMAILDALALAMALRTHPVADALPAYAAMRRWHVRLYQAMSAAFTPQYQSASRVLPVLRDHVLAPLSRVPPVPKILNRLVSGDIILPLAGQRFP